MQRYSNFPVVIVREDKFSSDTDRRNALLLAAEAMEKEMASVERLGTRIAAANLGIAAGAYREEANKIHV